jgi:hypothetical protein
MLVICASEPFHLTEMKERTRRTFTKNTFIHFHLFIHKGGEPNQTNFRFQINVVSKILYDDD